MSAPKGTPRAVLVPIERLVPDPQNPRTINRAALDRLKYSLSTYGIVQPAVFNEKLGLLAAGHQRVQVARELGYTEFPTVLVSWDRPTHAAAEVALNSTYGAFDDLRLRDLVCDLAAKDYDLDALALPTLDLEDLLASTLPGDSPGEESALSQDQPSPPPPSRPDAPEVVREGSPAQPGLELEKLAWLWGAEGSPPRTWR